MYKSSKIEAMEYMVDAEIIFDSKNTSTIYASSYKTTGIIIVWKVNLCSNRSTSGNMFKELKVGIRRKTVGNICKKGKTIISCRKRLVNVDIFL